MKPHNQTAAVGIGMIAVMVVIEMIVIVSVVNGSLTHDMTLQRIDTNQAFYAAEAGVALALRESWLAIDEDGDGTAGSISDDANAANDPAIGSGRVRVSILTNLSDTTLTAYGKSNLAHRKIKLDLTAY